MSIRRYAISHIRISLHRSRFDLLITKLYGNICRASVLYDRPPAQFQSISLATKHDLFYKLSQDYPEFLSDANDKDDELEATRFTYKDPEGIVHLRPQRPAILVSSTSWTPDEDFSILLKALDRKWTAHRHF